MENYFFYLPDNGLCDAWQCTAISMGHTVIPSNTIYPPRKHPDDHQLDWRSGRILQAYQIVLVSAGSGTLDYGPERKRVCLKGGDIFLLFPGVWHRYEPSPQTGWTEHWIECKGKAFDIAKDRGILSPDTPLFQSNGMITDLFMRIHQLAQDDAVENQALISTYALSLLAVLSRPEGEVARKSELIVNSVRMYLLEHHADDLTPNELARRFGVSYSYLRRLFRQQTGVSIKQFQLNIRLQRGCELLANSDRSIKEIAAILGFANTFHFSKFFSKEKGVPPTEWRNTK
nr:AraC family transcriptional regulator [uncultured Cohaesibacter sp.]